MAIAKEHLSQLDDGLRYHELLVRFGRDPKIRDLLVQLDKDPGLRKALADDPTTFCWTRDIWLPVGAQISISEIASWKVTITVQTSKTTISFGFDSSKGFFGSKKSK